MSKMQKKYVIYTVVTGGYNKVLQPITIDNRFDYVLFSNDFVENKIGVWNIRSIPEVISNDNKRLSRYPKTHPEELLSEYNYTLYIDANIQIKDTWLYDRVVELADSNLEYAGVKLLLTGCDCIYEHTLDMCSLHVENDINAIVQCHYLYRQGFPQHYGLNENNIIFRKNSEKMKLVDEEWWDCIVNYSFRDQFSYMYCLWKYNIPNNYIFPEGEDSHNTKHLVFIHHNKTTIVAKNKFLKKTFLERCRLFLYTTDKSRGLKYWRKAYSSNYPIGCLNIYMAILFILNFNSLLKRLLAKLC